MIDEIFDRTYQSGRTDLHAGIDRLAVRIRNNIILPFQKLERIQFDAPWNRTTKA